MTPLHLDLETRSAVDLKKTGVYRYAEDPTTDVWCAAYAFGDEPMQFWTPGEPCPFEIAMHVASGGEIRAWNANFERVLWRHVLGPKHGWPEPATEQWACVMVRAMALGLPASLDQCAPAVGLDIRKDDKGHRLMLQMARPRKIEGGRITWWDEAEKRERLYAYCRQDVEVERALDKRLFQLIPYERKVWHLDQKINDRGVRLDRDLALAARKVVAAAQEKADRAMARATMGEVTGTSQVQRLVNWLQLRGVETTSVSKENLEDLLGEDLPDDVEQALRLREESAKASTAKIEAFLMREQRDGRVRGNLQYHGAGPGRWAARGVQLQNLPRTASKEVNRIIEVLRTGDVFALEMIFGPALPAVADCLRGMIVAAPGHEFVVADFAAIEARVLAWLAGQQDLVDLFAKDGPVYETTAEAIYGRPINKADHPQERQVGKTTVLGAGYGMGGKKFKATLKKQAKIIVEQKFADDTIAAYRERFPRIKAYWGEIEAAAIEAVQRPGAVVRCGRVAYRKIGFFLLCQLPSGRAIAYPYPELRTEPTPWGETRPKLYFKGVNALTRQWGEESTYGGKLVENIVQGTARDLMAEAMFRVEANGYPVVLTVHDEIVSEVPLGFGSVTEFEHLMAAGPAWAAGCPIKAEGWRGTRYRKG